MRRRLASASDGTVDQRRVLSKELLVAVGLAALAIWMVVAFAQELVFAHGLSAQARALAAQNAQIAAVNQGYSQDIADVSTGAAAEEDARQNGYARSDEKLYLITQAGTAAASAPPAPSQAAPSQPLAKVSAGGVDPLSALRALIGHHG